jgi:hypothetical protein
LSSFVPTSVDVDDDDDDDVDIGDDYIDDHDD